MPRVQDGFARRENALRPSFRRPFAPARLKERRAREASLGTVLLLVVLVVSSSLGFTGTASARGALPLSCTSGCQSLALLNLSSVGASIPSTFWGTTLTPRAYFLTNQTQLFESTPTQVIVYPGADAGDAYDPLSGVITNSKTGATSAALVNESEFVNFCNVTHCQAILQVPGEIDNPGLAEAIVNYTEKNLSFHPAFWEIGNEPALWAHWGIPWSNWGNGVVSTVDALQYAEEVDQYTIAMRQADPTAQFIGLPGVGKGGSLQVWVRSVVHIDGPNITAVAVHEYPANANVNLTLSQFYATLQDGGAIPARAKLVHQWISSEENDTSGCSSNRCDISLFLTEIGSGLSHRPYGRFESGFPGALDLGAQMLQSLNASIPNVDLYAAVFSTANSWFSLNGTARPDYALYANVLTHLGGRFYPVNIWTPQPRLSAWEYAGAAADPVSGRNDLLAVNTNTSWSVSFVPSFPSASVNGPVEVWTWNNNTTAAPVPRFYPTGIGGSISLPPQSMVLLETYASANGAPLDFSAQSPSVGPAFANGTRWFVDVGGSLYESAGANLTAFLPTGTYPLGAPDLAVVTPATSNRTGLPYERNVSGERIHPFLAPSVDLASSGSQVPVTFVHQWSLRITDSPSAAGSVTPSPPWGNASQPLTLTETPALGYMFSHWFGWGPGSFNGTSTVATLAPAAPISEKAIFATAYVLTMTETGLPSGTTWSVTLRGSTQYSNLSSIPFFVRNGTYGFSIGNVSGFRAHPSAGSVAVNGSGFTVPVVFQPETPPPPDYAVTFEEVGLPAGTNWSVSVRSGVPVASVSNLIVFDEPNGTWGFKVTNLSGYRAHPDAGSVNVTGGPTSVTILFNRTTPPPPTYPVTLQETGLPAGTSWSASFRNGTPVFSTSATIVFSAPNGTWGFQIGSLPGYRAHPPAGSVNVSGAAVVVPILFNQTTPPPTVYAVTFVEDGLPNGTNWSVSLRGGSPVASVGDAIIFGEPNGTWGFSVLNVTGFRAHPDAGSVNVSGGPANLTVVFNRTTPPALTYTVTFEEVGLPTGTDWSVTVRASVLPTTASSVSLALSNGSYGYRLGIVPGFRAVSPNTGFDVVGAPVLVSVSFEVNRYAVTWVASGYRENLTWNVTVAGSTMAARSAWVSTNLANGTWPFSITSTPEFRAATAEPAVVVVGAGQIVNVSFTEVEEPVTFLERGLPMSTPWTIRFSNYLVNETAGIGEVGGPLMIVKGTYTFDVAAPSGYYPTPSHGNQTVNGSTSLEISFYPTGPGPIPSIWTVGPRALLVASVLCLSAWAGFVLLGRRPRIRGTNGERP